MLTSFLLKKDTFVFFVLFFLLVFLQGSFVFGQCPEGDISFTTQEQIDAFSTNYPNCKELTGSVSIKARNSYILNLTGLQNLVSIDGTFTIEKAVFLPSLVGLENLESVGGLRIISTAIANLVGLQNLRSTTFLTIADNILLVDILSLKEITAVSSITIRNNDALRSLSGLENLNSISGNLDISENNNLKDISSLKQIPSVENLTIYDNDSLTTLSGLENLNFVSETCRISDNDALVNLAGLNNLQSIGGNLTITGNDALSNLTGLDNLNLIGGWLDIHGNDKLSDLSALSNLTEVGNLSLSYTKRRVSGNTTTSYESTNENLIENLAQLENIKIISGLLDITDTDLYDFPFLKNIVSVGALNIDRNFNLTDFSGLSNLSSIGSVKIQSNPLLKDLSFLSNIKVFDDFEIKYNNSLSNVSSLENLDTVRGNLNIIGNSTLSSLSGLENLVSIGGFKFPFGGLAIIGNDSLKNFKGLENIDTIRGYLSIVGNWSLSSFAGLENLVSIGRDFFVGYNSKLTNFSELENLVSLGSNLIVHGNISLVNFEGLKKLQSIGADFLVAENHTQIDFTGLESLNSVGGNLRVGGGIDPLDYHHWYNPNPYSLEGNNALENFKGLEPLSSIGGHLQIAHLDALTSLAGLENLKSVGKGYSNLSSPSLIGLAISDNLLLTSLSGLDALTIVEGPVSISSNISLKNLSGLENLDSIGSVLSITSNDVLTDIIALENLSPYHSKLNIYDNTSLSSCNIRSVCNYLNNIEKPFYIANNYSGCNSETEILENCGRAKIQSHFFYDLNQNKTYDNNEPYASFGSVILIPDNIRIIQNPKTGYGVQYVDPGIYTISIDEASITNSTLTTDSVTYNFNLDQDDCKVLNFGVYPNQPVSEMRSYMFSPNARCNESSPFTLHTKNWGTTNTKGILWFKADTVITTLYFIEEPDTIIQPNQYGWSFDNLMPSQYLTKYINVGIPGIGQVELGQNLSFESFAEFTDNNGQQFSTSVFNYQTPVRCSYDPNDKLVNPNRSCNHILMDENITYTIRFQNTGNDVAYKVSITDEIDANLDLNTFSLINSSHIDSLQTSISDNGTVTFQFNNINLPDSTTNLEGSQGYVSYSIKAKTDLPENTIIKNTSAIYFDFNPPIITNTVENILVSELPNTSWCRDFNENGLGNPNESIESCEQPEGYVADCSDLNDLVSIAEESVGKLINIYPNPSNGAFKIEADALNAKVALISVYNVNGKQIIEPTALKQNQKWLNYPFLENGIYYLKINIDGLALKKKLVVAK